MESSLPRLNLRNHHLPTTKKSEEKRAKKCPVQKAIHSEWKKTRTIQKAINTKRSPPIQYPSSERADKLAHPTHSKHDGTRISFRNGVHGLHAHCKQHTTPHPSNKQRTASQDHSLKIKKESIFSQHQHAPPMQHINADALS
jgi:hypothetical protein